MRVPGTTADGLLSTGSHLLFFDKESVFGRDRNGDGDTADLVVSSYDEMTNAVERYGLADAFLGDVVNGGYFAPVTSEGDVLVFEIGEADGGGVDLNGDGDATDWLYYLYDAQSDTVTPTLLRRPLGICLDPNHDPCGPTIDIQGPWVAFQDYEDGFVDRNLDGDKTDVCHVLVNVQTGQVLDPHLAGYFVFMANESKATVGAALALLPVDESEQGGTDLNGNGTTYDRVLYVLDLATGATTLIDAEIEQDTAPACAALPGGFAFAALENTSRDYNQDGDSLDRVLQVYDHATGTLFNTGAAVYQVLPDVVGTIVRVDLDERGCEQDLDGDGDQFDHVLALLDTTTLQITSTGLADLVEAGVSGSRALHILSEPAGGVDLNGDGDTLDSVPALLDGAAGTFTVLPVAVTVDQYDASPILRENYLLLPVSEADQGATDLNGDGDATDTILYVLDLDTSTVTRAPYAALPYSDVLVGPEFLYYGADEQASGGVDLNGDGDACDTIWMAIDRSTMAARSLLFPYGTGAVLDDGELGSSTYEWFAGYDLNHDGDLFDTVMVVLDPHAF